MGYKNRTHQIKRVISPRKFSRLFSQNLSQAGVCTIYRSHDEGFVNSLQAVELNGIIYARFPCRNPEGNRLETFCIRYLVEQPLDNAHFRKYPNQLIKKSVELF